MKMKIFNEISQNSSSSSNSKSSIAAFWLGPHFKTQLGIFLKFLQIAKKKKNFAEMQPQRPRLYKTQKNVQRKPETFPGTVWTSLFLRLNSSWGEKKKKKTLDV